MWYRDFSSLHCIAYRFSAGFGFGFRYRPPFWTILLRVTPSELMELSRDFKLVLLQHHIYHFWSLQLTFLQLLTVNDFHSRPMSSLHSLAFILLCISSFPPLQSSPYSSSPRGKTFVKQLMFFSVKLLKIALLTSLLSSSYLLQTRSLLIHPYIRSTLASRIIAEIGINLQKQATWKRLANLVSIRVTLLISCELMAVVLVSCFLDFLPAGL